MEVFDEKEFKFFAFDLVGYYAQLAAIKILDEKTSKIIDYFFDIKQIHAKPGVNN